VCEERNVENILYGAIPKKTFGISIRSNMGKLGLIQSTDDDPIITDIPA
jgi:hypothetical protein